MKNPIHTKYMMKNESGRRDLRSVELVSNLLFPSFKKQNKQYHTHTQGTFGSPWSYAFNFLT